eukprot:TRINITY_DN3295_c0_g2_i1.p1 TRINITY_DN3295_c0_g2~~TRINITY_DN3295_c0_g2_i1.p1  ORF type:complete len:333 (-),score=119.65 TRINITY_DN3295_c0_g2_i1:33-893(-)
MPPMLYDINEDTRAILNNKKAKSSTPSIPPLSQLTKQRPSSQLLHNVCNVLYAYAYMMRLYDGIWWEKEDEEGREGEPKHSNNKGKGRQRIKTPRAIECYSVINEISRVLSQNATYSDVSVALNDAMECSLSKPFVANSRSFSISIVLDVYCLLYQKSFVLSALSDLLRLHVAIRDLTHKSDKSSSKRTKKEQLQLQQQKQKIYFFLVWANEVLDDVVTLPLLRNDVKTEYLKLMETMKPIAKASTSTTAPIPSTLLSSSSSSTQKPYNPLLASSASSKPLIEELK